MKVYFRLTGYMLQPADLNVPDEVRPGNCPFSAATSINTADLVLQRGLNITVNADDTLNSFCNWQMGLNHAEDSHPNHHDVAILVTR
jgi:hypothetical protein